MKKLFALFLAFSLVASTGMVGCGGAVDNSVKKEKAAKRPPTNTKEEDDAAANDPEKATSFAGGKGGLMTAPK